MNITYVASTMIAGLIMISLVMLNVRIARNSGEQTLYNMAKIQTEMVAEYVAMDFRTMGYGISGPAILVADTARIRFRVHYEGDPDPTVIEWYFAVDSTLAYPNPDIRPLYRSDASGTVQVGTGITRFTLNYLDVERNLLNPAILDFSQVHQIRLELMAESTEGFGDIFPRAFWSGEFTPVNIQ